MAAKKIVDPAEFKALIAENKSLTKSLARVKKAFAKIAEALDSLREE